MKILVDATIFLAVIMDKPEKPKIIEQTKGCDILSPYILPYEIGNALIAMLKRRRIDGDSIEEYYNIFL